MSYDFQMILKSNWEVLNVLEMYRNVLEMHWDTSIDAGEIQCKCNLGGIAGIAERPVNQCDVHDCSRPSWCDMAPRFAHGKQPCDVERLAGQVLDSNQVLNLSRRCWNRGKGSKFGQKHRKLCFSNVNCELERRMDIGSLFVGEDHLRHFPDGANFPFAFQSCIQFGKVLLVCLHHSHAISVWLRRH